MSMFGGIPATGGKSMFGGIPVDQATATSPDTIDSGTAAGYGFLQSTTFGFGDELLSAAIAPFSDLTYSQLRDAARERQQVAMTEEPGAYLGGSIGSAIISAPLMPVAKGATTIGGAIKGAAISGAAQGGLQGIGEGEGFGRITSGLGGAAVGGAVGGTLSSIAQAARPVAAKAKALIGAIPPEKQAAQVLNKNIGRTAVAKGITPEQVITRGYREMLRGNQQGLPTTLADVGDENIQGLAEGLAQRPGVFAQKASDLVESRSINEIPRIKEAISAKIAKTGEFLDVSQTLEEQMRNQSRPFYDAAFKQSRPISDFAPVVNRPAFRSALERAKINILNAGGDPATTLQLDNLMQTKGLTTDNRIGYAVIDQIKKAMDDIIEDARDPITGMVKGPNAQGVQKAKQAFLDIADSGDVGKIYAAGRNIYAGGAQLKDALTEGSGFLKGSYNDLALKLKRMTASEKAMFKMGAVDAIEDTLERKTGGSKALQIVKNENVRKRLRLLFDTDAEFNSFVKKMENEVKATRTGQRLLAGSQTARRMAIKEDIDAVGGSDLAVDLLTGGGMTMGSLANRALQGLKTAGINDRTVSVLSDVLLETDPQKAKDIIRMLVRQNYINEQAARQINSRIAAGAAVGSKAVTTQTTPNQ